MNGLRIFFANGLVINFIVCIHLTPYARRVEYKRGGNLYVTKELG
jgi:hypothetical protein